MSFLRAVSFFIFIFFYISVSYAKRPITFKDILKFEALRKAQITDNGKWVSYELNKERGNDKYVIQSLETDTKYIIVRGINSQYSNDTKWFAIKQEVDVIKKLNEGKENKEKPDLELLNTETGKRSSINDISGYSLCKNGKWLIYTKEYDKKDKKKGKQLVLHHLNSETEIPIENVYEYELDSLGNNIFYSTLTDKGINGIYSRDLNSEFVPEKTIETDSSSKFTDLTWNESSNKLIYLKGLLSKDDKTKDNAIKSYDIKSNSLIILADTSSRDGYYIPEINDIRFTDDNQRIWFGYKPLGEWYGKEKDTTKITEENLYDTDLILDKTELYIWHNKDPEIIPVQINDWHKNKDRTYLSYYDIGNKKIVYLSDSTEKGVSFTNNSNYTLQYNFEPYKRLITYEGWFQDLYSVDIETGKKTLIVKKLDEFPTLSPNGLYTLYFQDSTWYSHNNETNKTIALNKNIGVPFYDVLSDVPKEPYSYGIRGWIGKEDKVIIRDQFDLWEFDLETGNGKLLTNGYGRKNKVAISPIKYNDKQKWFEQDEIVAVKLFGTKTKEKQLGLLNLSNGEIEIKTQGEYLYSIKAKAKYVNKILLTKEGFSTYPDLWISDTLLSNFNQITHLQSQVDSFLWGKSYMMDYVTEYGDTLEGFYVLPDNYQKGKKYPVFVYFYERFSNRKNQFNMPIVNHRPPFSLYLGSGYVMFFPDIKFYTGSPGKSSEVALLAGCNKLVEMGIAEPKKIVLHGHSWSGYESAYIVTQTDYFAACVSGAPVSNMTSAYSGIRLGSGLARQFQYEKGQSRIGGNIIDSLQAYIRNSPIFFANQMNTPLLVMFGDRDDAVPWDQGVELYLAMRRFDKNCIFLQYADEPHHLKKIENQLDYSIRMKQFMDYYVFGGKMPKWMVDGFRYKGTYNIGR